MAGIVTVMRTSARLDKRRRVCVRPSRSTDSIKGVLLADDGPGSTEEKLSIFNFEVCEQSEPWPAFAGGPCAPLELEHESLTLEARSTVRRDVLKAPAGHGSQRAMAAAALSAELAAGSTFVTVTRKTALLPAKLPAQASADESQFAVDLQKPMHSVYICEAEWPLLHSVATLCFTDLHTVRWCLQIHSKLTLICACWAGQAVWQEASTFRIMRFVWFLWHPFLATGPSHATSRGLLPRSLRVSPQSRGLASGGQASGSGREIAFCCASGGGGRHIMPRCQVSAIPRLDRLALTRSKAWSEVHLS